MLTAKKHVSSSDGNISVGLKIFWLTNVYVDCKENTFLFCLYVEISIAWDVRMVDIVSDCVQNAGIALLLNNVKNVEIALFVVLMISNEQHCIWCFAMRCLMIESKIALLKCWHCYNFFLCQLSTSTLISLHFLNCKYPNFGFWNILFLPWKSLTFNLNRAVLRALIYCW